MIGDNIKLDEMFPKPFRYTSIKDFGKDESKIYGSPRPYDNEYTKKQLKNIGEK